MKKINSTDVIQVIYTKTANGDFVLAGEKVVARFRCKGDAVKFSDYLIESIKSQENDITMFVIRIEDSGKRLD